MRRPRLSEICARLILSGGGDAPVPIYNYNNSGALCRTKSDFITSLSIVIDTMDWKQKRTVDEGEDRQSSREGNT